MSDIPQDLVIDILLRLPVKSVCRFKCVSKPWWLLLSSPSFVKAHLKLHIQDPEELIFTVPFSEQPLHILTFTAESRNNANLRMINFPMNDETCIRVGASGYGLVLLLLSRKHEDRTVLMNPITLEAVEVPHRPYSKYCSYGIAFDSSKDDYIIVSISTESIVEIYSVKMRTWRRLANFPHAVFSPAPGVFLNTRIHWMTFSGSSTFSGWALTAFSLAGEEVEEVPLPSGVEFDTVHATEIRALDGCLALVCESNRSGINVWMMKEYGVQNSWTKLATIKEIINGNSIEFFCLLSKDEVVLRKNGEFVTYNQRNGAWRDMVIANIPDGFYRGAQTFRGSFLSPY